MQHVSAFNTSSSGKILVIKCKIIHNCFSIGLKFQFYKSG